MTSKLHLPLKERRSAGRERRHDGSAGEGRRSVGEGQRAGREGRAGPQAMPQTARHDVAASRVREAGGPMDVASYACLCGVVFAAAVSTTVACPHCGATQAW